MTTEEAFGLLARGEIVYGEQFGARPFRIHQGQFQALSSGQWFKSVIVPNKWFDQTDEPVSTLWGTVMMESAGNA